MHYAAIAFPCCFLLRSSKNRNADLCAHALLFTTAPSFFAPEHRRYYSNTHTWHFTRDIKIRRGQAAQGNIILRCQRSQATERFMSYLLLKTPLCSYSLSERCLRGRKINANHSAWGYSSPSAWYILLYIFCLVNFHITYSSWCFCGGCEWQLCLHYQLCVLNRKEKANEISSGYTKSLSTLFTVVTIAVLLPIIKNSTI